MTAPPPRDAATRKADSLAQLRTPAADVWVASAAVTGDGSAQVHLVPLSLAWVDDKVVLAVERDSRTARNIAESGRARVAVGPTRDVVMIDAIVERSVDLAEGSDEVAEAYAAQADWDPRTVAGDYVYLVLRPNVIQAWREANELTGRTLMRGGRWLV